MHSSEEGNYLRNNHRVLRPPSSELCVSHEISQQSVLYPDGIAPQSQGLEGTTYPGNKVQNAFPTPKMLRRSSAI
ncbi:MAG: hypothetical protein ACI8V5_004840 [Limisphaerales bacterium]|jgi:hypothetical protein